MNIYNLEKKQIVNLGNFSGAIECTDGAVWVSYKNMDVVLENQYLKVENGKNVVIQSLRQSRVSVY